MDNPLTKSSLCQHYYAPNSWSSPHTCWGQTSGRAPRPTAEAKTARCQTSSGSETQVRGRQLLSCSWRNRTPPGKTGEGPNLCPRSQRTVFPKAVGAGCSAQPRASRLGRQTAAAWVWWAACRCGCDGWRPQEGTRGTVPFHITAGIEKVKWVKRLQLLHDWEVVWTVGCLKGVFLVWFLFLLKLLTLNAALKMIISEQLNSLHEMIH